VEFSDDAIVGTTLQGVVTSWNPAAERMYGYSAKQMIGRSGRILAYPGRADQMYVVLARTAAGQVVEHLELDHVRKDGTVVRVSLTVAPIRDEDGVIVGSSAVARDVTEQRRAFEVAARMAAIVENSDDAIIGSTLERIITSWNPAAERMFGYSSEEIVGKSASLLTPQDRADESVTILARIGAGQHVEHLETTGVRQDGTLFPVSLTASPIRDPDGVIVGTSAIVRDMTKEMLHQQEIVERRPRRPHLVGWPSGGHIADRRDHQKDVPGINVGHADIHRQRGAIAVPPRELQIQSTGPSPGV